MIKIQIKRKTKKKDRICIIRIPIQFYNYNIINPSFNTHLTEALFIPDI